MDYNNELIRLDNLDLDADFVSISCEIADNGYCKHSGFIINFQDQIFYFHYSGEEVLLEDITANFDQIKNIYIKELDIIPEPDVVSFLGHCQKLKKKGVHPTYGFVFDNSYYDPNTKDSFLVNAQHDITTCVGFCIKVIRGFLYNHEEYLKIGDWSNLNMEEINPRAVEYINHFLEKYAKANNISVDELFDKGDLKRITPSEILTSTYFQDLPISKNSIDEIRPGLEEYFLKMVA